MSTHIEIRQSGMIILGYWHEVDGVEGWVVELHDEQGLIDAYQLGDNFGEDSADAVEQWSAEWLGGAVERRNLRRMREAV